MLRKIALLVGLVYVAGFGQNCVGTAGQLTWKYWNGFRSTPDTNALRSLENFPTLPNGTYTVASLASPVNFEEYYAGMLQGYLEAPATGQYIFNITGDDRATFYLGTTDVPSSKRKIADVPSYTAITEHEKYPSQTSVAINLVQGQKYYFELLNFEGGYGDHAVVYWKKPGDIAWTTVTYQYLYDYSCGTVCPPRGTTCSDNDPTTTGDQQDGFCNCVGIKSTTNACVGEKGKVEVYYFDNITGSYVENDLLNAPEFPEVPDRRELLKGINGPLETYTKENYGTHLQGYLTVPLSGNYEFNLTGDNQTIFFLSKNDSAQYKRTHFLEVKSGVGEYERSVHFSQTSAPIFLEKGKYYYFELMHKESGWRDFFTLFWKTPFHQPQTWKIIPSFYLFDYACELACIAQNTPCDDGNAFTNNDLIDANCNCVGIPCSGPDCNDLGAKYSLYEDCSPTNNLLPLAEAQWQSCTATPNPARTGTNHWIRFDFADVNKLGQTRVWNYNVAGQTNKGFNQVVVDYTTDGSTWQQLGGTYNWPEAPGQADYAGFIGPNFVDIKAKSVVFTALSNHNGGSCAGIAKITMEGTVCNPKDTPCDDGDPLTFFDKFDNACNCRGIDISCVEDSIALGKIQIDNPQIAALSKIKSESIINNSVTFTAGDAIVLLPGFEAKNETLFFAIIKDCLQPAGPAQTNTAKGGQANGIEPQTSLFDTETSPKQKRIIFRLDQPGQVLLEVRNQNGQTLSTLVDAFQENLGTQIKLLPTNKLKKGSYLIYLKINQKVVEQEFVVE